MVGFGLVALFLYYKPPGRQTTIGRPRQHAQDGGMLRRDGAPPYDKSAIERINRAAYPPVREQRKIRGTHAAARAFDDGARERRENRPVIHARLQYQVALARRLQAHAGKDTEVPWLLRLLGHDDACGAD